MRALFTGDEREERVIEFIEEHGNEYRRVISISSVKFEDASNQFREMPIDIMKKALWIRERYPDEKFPFLFIFHGMCWDLSHNCKPFYADFFQKTNWIVTSMKPDSMPMFIRGNVTKK
jgi:hypothetical protein